MPLLATGLGDGGMRVTRCIAGTVAGAKEHDVCDPFGPYSPISDSTTTAYGLSACSIDLGCRSCVALQVI